MESKPILDDDDDDLCLNEDGKVDEVYRRCKQVLQEKGVLKFCPTPYCTVGYTFDEGNGDPFDCPSCHHLICIRCAVPYHEGKTCEFYQNSQTGQEFSVNKDFSWSRNTSEQKREHDAVLHHAKRYIQKRRETQIFKNKGFAKEQEPEDTNRAKKQKLDHAFGATMRGILMPMTQLVSQNEDEFNCEGPGEKCNAKLVAFHKVLSLRRRCHPGGTGTIRNHFNYNMFGTSKVTIHGMKSDILGGKPRKYFCPTPDCTMQYEFGEGCDDSFSCSSCQKLICTKCHVVYHDGMTCEMYQNSPENEDHSLKVWLSADPKNRRICSTCSSPIEKNEGCNHVVCMLCQSDICFKCGVTFLSDSDFRDHCLQCLHF